MANPFSLIQSVSDATAAVAREIAQHEQLKNSPDLQQALVIHRIQAVLDNGRKAIQDENLDEVRKMVAAADAGIGGA